VVVAWVAAAVNGAETTEHCLSLGLLKNVRKVLVRRTSPSDEIEESESCEYEKGGETRGGRRVGTRDAEVEGLGDGHHEAVAHVRHETREGSGWPVRPSGCLLVSSATRRAAEEGTGKGWRWRGEL
jgi:hypothetical protein